MVENVIIIGSGPAGLTAALYAAREDFMPLVVAGMAYGGQLQLTTSVENYPAFPDGIMGPDLVQKMRVQAEKFGARFINEDVTEIDLSRRPYHLKLNSREFETHSVIVATGASAKWLGIESEQKLVGKGVSSCATCDGPLYRGGEVAVVGGGDTAMEDSLFLTKFVDHVTIIHRRDELRASKIMQERVLSNPKIEIMWDSVVEEVIGEDQASALKIKNVRDGKETELPVDALFVAIGHAPNTEFLGNQLKLDEHGYVITRDEVLTDIDGVFVAGDVADKKYRQAITAAGSGAKAALEARSFLQEKIYAV